MKSVFPLLGFVSFPEERAEGNDYVSRFLDIKHLKKFKSRCSNEV